MSVPPQAVTFLVIVAVIAAVRVSTRKQRDPMIEFTTRT